MAMMAIKSTMNGKATATSTTRIKMVSSLPP
jgi:hypothetical protein